MKPRTLGTTSHFFAFSLLACCLAAACGGDDSEAKDEDAQGSTGTVEAGGECIARADCKDAFADCRCDGYGRTECVVTPVGTPCESLLDCAPDMRCVDDACAPYVPKGGICGYGEGICAAGSTCRDDVCGAPGAIGEPCEDNEPDPCVPEAYCAGEICVARHAEGELCDSNDSCVDGAVCASVGAPSKCYPQKKVGESCVHASQCPAGSTCNGLCQEPFAAACNG